MKRVRLPPQVILLGIAALLNDLSSDIIFPLLPIFLTTELGATVMAIGVIEGVADALSSAFKFVAGNLSDRFPRRKPLVVAGYALAGLSRLGIAMATRWPVVFAARLADRTGKGIRSAPRDALICDVTPRENWGRAFGVHRAFDHTGAVLGPLLAALMVGPLAMPLRQIFYLAAIPSLLAVLLLVLRLREEKRAPVARSATALDAPVKLPAAFWSSMAPIAMFALANSSDAFLIVQAHAAGVPPAHIALLWAAHHAVKVVIAPRAGALSDRVDRRYLLIAGWTIYALVYFLFPMTSSFPMFLVLFLIYAVPFALTEGAERAWVSDPVAPEIRGRAFGVYYLTAGLFTLLGTLIFGAVYQAGGKAQAFYLAAGFAMVAAALAARRGGHAAGVPLHRS